MTEYNTTLFTESIGFKQTEEELNKNFCGTGRALTVDSKGNLYPCVRYIDYSLQNKPGYILGDIYSGISLDKVRPFKILTAKIQSKKECIECPVSTGCAYCQAQNYDSSKCSTNFERAMFSCLMHKARVRANNYYWAKLYNIYNIEREKEFSIYRAYEKKMFFMLNDNCAQLCANYRKVSKGICMSKEILLEGLNFAREEFYQPIFVGESYKDIARFYNDEQMKMVLDGYMIKHIIPFVPTADAVLARHIKLKDVIYTFDNSNIELICESQVTNCMLFVRNNELDKLTDWVSEILNYFSRINLKCEIDTSKDLEIYCEKLEEIESLLVGYAVNGKICEVNVITDRLFIDKMDNCFAGEKNITLGPNGQKYCCPAFYYTQEINNSFGENKKQYEMTKLEYAPLCKECDAFQCERCVYKNKISTFEYAVPAKLQCTKAHRERTITLQLKADLEKIGKKLKFQNIEEIEYDDPCEKVIKMWNLV